jgi:hypothetical protein
MSTPQVFRHPISGIYAQCLPQSRDLVCPITEISIQASSYHASLHAGKILAKECACQYFAMMTIPWTHRCRGTHSTGCGGDWEISVGVKIGDHGTRGESGTWVLYCRMLGGDVSREWRWRYGISLMDWGSDLCDTVEEFLDFYAHFRKQEEDDVDARDFEH